MTDAPDRQPKSNYPSNSQRGKNFNPEPNEKTEKPEVKAVVSQPAIQRKKGIGRRMIETFAGDSLKSTSSYLLFEVILPQVKNTIVDVGSQGLERFFFGDVKGRLRPSQGSVVRGPSRTSYNTMYKPDPRQVDPRPPLSQRAREVHDFDEIVLPTKGDAEVVLENLRILVDTYEQASVGDLLSLVGVTGEFTDQKWGWNDLRSATIIRVHDGYMLNLPRTIPLDA